MTAENDGLEPPTSSAGDKAHALARAATGSIPLVGAKETELFQMLIAPPLERRRQAWMDAVAEALRRLEREKGIDIEQLKDNDTFIDTIMQASQVALRNSQQEKLDALRNAVLNSACPHPVDQSLQQMFLNLVDLLTVWHIRILKLLSNPVRWFHERGRRPPEYPITGSLVRFLIDAYPKLRRTKDSHVGIDGSRVLDLCADVPRARRAGGFDRCHLMANSDQEPPLSHRGSHLVILVHQGSDPTQPYPTSVIRDRASRFFPRLFALGSETTLSGPSVGVVTLWDQPPLTLSILPGPPPVSPTARGGSCPADAVQLPATSGPGRVLRPAVRLPLDRRSEGAETPRLRDPARADQVNSNGQDKSL